ncbi:MAG: cytochrome c oxidase subunit II [Gammaproteobacteria bacterium]
MFVAVIFAIIIIASIIFHFWSPWWWTPVASNWGNIDDTIILSFWVTGAVFVGVCLFMAYCVWRYRYRPDRRAEYEPENKKLEWRLTWLTSLGVAVLLAPGLLVWNQFVTVPKNAFNVEVVAYQWGWNYRLPGEDSILGKTDAKLVSYENPYGLNLNDPNGKDDIIVQDADLHLQIDQPVKINLRSLDVIHNFYVPQFRAKMDTLPGIVSYYWFTPTKTGKYEILCAEFCGTGHYAMRGTVLVDEKKDYNNWLAQQITFEQILAQENMIKEPKKLVKNINKHKH